LNAVQKELNSLPNNRQYEKAYELQGRKREMEERVTELEEVWAETKKDAKQVVDEDEVAAIIFSMTGIPVSRLVEAETQKLFRMEDELHKRIIGQHEAIVAISKAVRRSRSGLRDIQRPIGSFIFLGPTGVGKTELARALAESMFDSEENMVRLDMSEYMEKHAVSRLIGAPPGYVGYDEGGQLTEAVRRKPYSVILFDEIEKAHVDVFNTLLQILDDGRLTDSQGRTVDFKNTIIIMTSNIGSRHLIENASEKSGEINDKTRDAVMAEMRAHFRPEFLNRVDEIVLFKPLTLAEIERIVDLQLNLLRARLAERHIELELNETAKELLARRGYDPVYGARPLKRIIQRELETKLSRSLLRGEITDNSRVEVVATKGELEFKSKPLPAAGK